MRITSRIGRRAAMATLALGATAMSAGAAGASGDQADVVPQRASSTSASAGDYGCTSGGIGTTAAIATCWNETRYPRHAHFHVDCWAWGDTDKDQTVRVGPYGEVQFSHYCWSHAATIEAYYLS